MPRTDAPTGRRPPLGPIARAAAILVLVLSSAVPAGAALPKLKTEVAFPNLSFDRPVAMAYPDGGSNLLFVVEQHQARIQSFPDDPTTKDKKLFLQLPSPINRGNEEGLLGLAFHPKYKENGQFFVYYSWQKGNDRHSAVSRFKVSKDDPRKADPSSEERIWVSAKDPFENHNGGCIEFGPDGYLYISLGDSGAADDPLTTGQNASDWFGSLLRIDVDHPAGGKPYGIPRDNPRLRDPKTFADWAPEVYCIGLRNVWKFTFDRKGGTLWAGDVGQNKYEIVHVIVNGGNYGWSVREGFHPFHPRAKVNRSSPILPPIAEYPHGPADDPKRKDYGQSITGGYVYRGKALPELDGVYVYGDFNTGRIWGVRLGKDGKAAESGELVDISKSRPLNIAGFGEDAKGELYILAFDGKIHRLARP
jgi:glucose/arabinose dehydrogenase